MRARKEQLQQMLLLTHFGINPTRAVGADNELLAIA
jgi:hypothetical protein